jgi:hypothetical protein
METLAPHIAPAAIADQLAERAAFSYVGSRLATSTHSEVIVGAGKPAYLAPGNIAMGPTSVGIGTVSSPYRPAIAAPTPTRRLGFIKPLRRARQAIWKTRAPAIQSVEVPQVGLIAYRRALDAQAHLVSSYRPTARSPQPNLYGFHPPMSLEARFQELVRAVSGRGTEIAHSQAPSIPRAKHAWYVDDPLTPPPRTDTKTVHLRLRPVGKASPRVPFDPDLE